MALMNPAAALLIATRDAAPLLDEARRAYEKARAHQSRLDLATLIVENEVPAGSTIMLLPFDDDPNPDGTYDIAFGEVYDTDGHPIDDITLSSSDAIAAGISPGVTAWDDLLIDGDWAVDVDRVYAWLDAVAITGLRG